MHFVISSVSNNCSKSNSKFWMISTAPNNRVDRGKLSQWLFKKLYLLERSIGQILDVPVNANSFSVRYPVIASAALTRDRVFTFSSTEKKILFAQFSRNSTLRYECDETFSDECEFAARAKGEWCNHACQENIFRTSIVRNFISRGVK